MDNYSQTLASKKVDDGQAVATAVPRATGAKQISRRKLAVMSFALSKRVQLATAAILLLTIVLVVAFIITNLGS